MASPSVDAQRSEYAHELAAYTLRQFTAARVVLDKKNLPDDKVPAAYLKSYGIPNHASRPKETFEDSGRPLPGAQVVESARTSRRPSDEPSKTATTSPA